MSIQERLVETLAQHSRESGIHDGRPHCICGWSGEFYMPGEDPHGAHQAEQITPVVEAHTAERERAALLAAADALTAIVDTAQSSDNPNPLSWQTGALAMRDQIRLRARSKEGTISRRELCGTDSQPAQWPGKSAGCRRCDHEIAAGLEASGDWVGALSRPFIVCSTCGNKRCPKASDHLNPCSGSNATGQDESIYS